MLASSRAPLAALALCLAAAGPAAAAFPGDDGRIAFSRLDGRAADVWSVNPDGSGARNLTRSPRLAERDPAFSPDGRRIAFVRWAVPRGGRPVRGAEVYVMDADGGGATRITRDGGFKHGVSWSPDGQRIAYHRDPASGRASRDADHSEIFTVPAAGGRPRQLTRNRVFDGDPTYTPAGEIVFEREVAGGTHDLHVMTSGGRDVRRLTVTDGADAAHADVSPDGSRLLFLRCCPPRGGYGGQLFSLTLDGSAPVAVTSGRRADGVPAWSPGGGALVFERRGRRGTGTRLYVMGADGTGFRALLARPGNDAQPSWGPAPR